MFVGEINEFNGINIYIYICCRGRCFFIYYMSNNIILIFNCIKD